jgi:hypothetical protein
MINSFSQHSRILIAAHDAGGAEILCAWMQNTQTVADIFAEGPAKLIFIREGFGDYLLETIELSNYQCLMTGTSYTALLERKLIQHANLLGIESIAVLDHWIHYAERFILDGLSVLPKTIWVGDDWAERLACSIFPHSNVVKTKNWYWLKIKQQVQPGRAGCWLVALENRAARQQSWEDSLSDIIEWLQIQPQITKIIIRPHPTQNLQQVQNYLNRLNMPDLRLSQQNLIEDLSACSGVVGYQTTVLALACITHKRAVSLVSGDEKLTIPMSQVETPLAH